VLQLEINDIQFSIYYKITFQPAIAAELTKLLNAVV
jgi:hypothetical protein